MANKFAFASVLVLLSIASSMQWITYPSYTNEPFILENVFKGDSEMETSTHATFPGGPFAGGKLSLLKHDDAEIEFLEALVGASTDDNGRIDNCPNVEGPKCDGNFLYRQPEGTCNNLNLTWWGSTNTIFKRILKPAFQDGVSEPRSLGVNGKPLPSAREVANKVHFPNDYFKHLTNFFTVFSQFVMHDLSGIKDSVDSNDQTVECNCDSTNRECLQIPIPKDDRRFGPYEKCLVQIRSRDARPYFNCNLKTRELLNGINSWVDLSSVYGNTKEQETSLRTMYGGQLAVSYFSTSSGPLLPSNCPANAFKRLKRHNVCFQSGDHRVNQYPMLTIMHTIFMREHNRMASELAKINPHWNDERLFQETKRILSAVYQHIVYAEWLRFVIGPDLHNIFHFVPEPQNSYFLEYRESMFPNVAVEFGVSAARFGHPLTRAIISKANDYYVPYKGELLRDIMFRPDKVIPYDSVSDYVKGMLAESSNENAPHFNDELFNWLIVDHGNKNPTEFNSLAALNVNRGRETGVPSYVYFRELAGLNFPHTFEELTHIDPYNINQLKSVYDHVADIDLFTGATCEKSLPGAAVGPTHAFIIARGFRDWKYADRFFYENDPANNPYAFTLEQLNAIKKMRMNSILCNTVNIKSVADTVFAKADPKENKLYHCSQVQYLDLTLFKEDP